MRLATLRGLYDFAGWMRFAAGNPAADVKRKERLSAPRGLCADELEALLAKIPATPAGARDLAIISIALLTRLRRAGLLRHRAGDLASDTGGADFYRVREGRVSCATRSFGPGRRRNPTRPRRPRGSA